MVTAKERAEAEQLRSPSDGEQRFVRGALLGLGEDAEIGQLHAPDRSAQPPSGPASTMAAELESTRLKFCDSGVAGARRRRISLRVVRSTSRTPEASRSS